MKVKIVGFEKKYYKEAVGLKLKEDDKKEVEASSGVPYTRVLQRMVNKYSATMYLILYEGKVSGIFGAVPSGKPGEGIGYLLTDEKINEYKWDMARYSIEVFVHLLKQFPIITNYVSSEHKVSVRWLKRFGARFDGKAYILHDPDVPFYKFELRMQDYV